MVIFFYFLGFPLITCSLQWWNHPALELLLQLIPMIFGAIIHLEKKGRYSLQECQILDYFLVELELELGEVVKKSPTLTANAGGLIIITS